MLIAITESINYLMTVSSRVYHKTSSQYIVVYYYYFDDTRVLLLLCLTSHSTIFQLYCGGQIYWWDKPEYPEKTTDLPKVTDKTFSHNVVSRTPHNVSGDRH